MKHYLLIGMFTFILTGSFTLIAKAQEKNETPAPASAEAETEAWLKYATPGEPHQYLQKLAGEWKIVAQVFTPDGEKTEATEGSAKFDSILGGRFVQQKYKGTMEGVPFEGIGVTGYDNSQKKYVGTWMDTLGTGILRTEGKYDPKTHTMTEHAEGSGPQGPMKMKMVTHYVDDDHFTFTMFMLVPGDQEIKMMQLTYSRK